MASTAFDKQETPLTVHEEDERVKAKRKMLGNIKFIGELGKLELVHEAILHKCIQQCLAKKKKASMGDLAEDIECMCQIMLTVGQRLDTEKAKNIMDQYFERITKISKTAGLPSRIRFMLEDLIDLRNQKWRSSRLDLTNGGPQSITMLRWQMMGFPPPFGFLPPGMAFGKDTWMNHPMFVGSQPSYSEHYKQKELEVNKKDIFGKPIEPAAQVTTPIVNKKPPPAKDLFEPHYLKPKSSINSMKSSESVEIKLTKAGTEREEKDGRRLNPWNKEPVKYAIPAVFPAKNQTSPSTSPHKNSPNLPRGPANKVVPKKLNGDSRLSLRPSYMASKKDEKPKAASTEELPAKRSQFTNLTINDKTTAKPKKNTVSKADINSKVESMIASYTGTKDMETVCDDLQSLVINVKHMKMAFKHFFYSCYLNDEQWNAVCAIMLECQQRSIASADTIVNIFCQMIEDAKVMEQEKGKEFVAHVAACFIKNELLNMNTFLEYFNDGLHYPTVFLTLQHLLKTKGQEWVGEVIKSSDVKLQSIFPESHRTDECVIKEARQKGLAFLFPHLCLKDELLQKMKDGETEENLLAWIKENLEDKVDSKQLIHVVVTCAVTMVTSESLATEAKPEKEVQEREKECLLRVKKVVKHFVSGEGELEALYATQVFCHQNNFPKDMLLRLFIIFYNDEIVEEETFLKWKEDINDAYPGKGKSLFQVNNWLQWLETADEEEEDEEEED